MFNFVLEIAWVPLSHRNRPASALSQRRTCSSKGAFLGCPRSPNRIREFVVLTSCFCISSGIVIFVYIMMYSVIFLIRYIATRARATTAATSCTAGIQLLFPRLLLECPHDGQRACRIPRRRHWLTAHGCQRSPLPSCAPANTNTQPHNVFRPGTIDRETPNLFGITTPEKLGSFKTSSFFFLFFSPRVQVFSTLQHP